MGVIRDAANSTYQDGSTSQPAQPQKAAIRSLFGTVEDQLVGAAAGLIRATTLAGLGSGTRVGQPGQVTAGSDKGEYAWSGSAWVRTGDVIDPPAIQSDLDAMDEKVALGVISSTSAAFAVSPETSQAIRLGNFPWAPADFTGWIYAWQPLQPTVLDSIVPLISVGAGATSLDLKVWRRAVSDAANMAAIGTLSGDELVYSRSVSSAEFSAAIGSFQYVPLSISGAGIALPSYIYAVELNAKTAGGGLGQIANGALTYSGTHPQWERGWYRNAAGGATAVPSTQRLPFRIIALTAKQQDIVQGQIDALAQNFLERDNAAAVDTGFGSRFNLSSNFRGCQIGVNFPVKVIPTRAILPFRVAADAASVYVRVYKRSASFVGSAAYGTDAGDVVVYEKLLALADVGLVADTDGYLTLDLTDMPVLMPEWQYGFEFSAKTSTLGSSVIAMASTARLADDPQWSKGYYSTATTSPPSWSAFSAASGLSFRLEKIGYDFASSTSSTGAIAPVVSSADQSVRTETAFTVSIPSVTLMRPSGAITMPVASATFDAPASASRSGSMSLTVMPSSAIVPNLPTKDQFISDVTVTRVSDGATLVPGTDYVIKPDQGAIGLPTDGAAVPVTFTATAHAQRYDLVSLNPITKSIVVAKGADRYSRDPEYYRAVLPAGNIPLYAAYVTWHGVDLVPVMHHRNRVRDDRKSDVAIWCEYCRGCLPKTLKLLRAASALKIIGYGDSITAIGGGAFTPNGASRDLANWLDDMPSDTKALFPTFDGPAGVGAHVHISWNWVLKSALERRYASTISYLNYGWGGTTSDNNNPDASHYGGLWPDRINPVLAEGAGLMILAFGMNELGSAATYGNVVSIIKQAQAAGQEVIVVTPPRCNEIGRSGVYDNWRLTHDALVLAALDTGSAYVSTFELSGKTFEGAVGRSPQSMCTMNLYNHPWPYELADIGNWIASIFD